jgi:hypothetical protein
VTQRTMPLLHPLLLQHQLDQWEERVCGGRFVDKPNGGQVLCDIMRGGNFGLVHHVTWLFSSTTSTSADVMCEGLVQALHAEDLGAVEKVSPGETCCVALR